MRPHGVECARFGTVYSSYLVPCIRQWRPLIQNRGTVLCACLSLVSLLIFHRLCCNRAWSRIRMWTLSWPHVFDPIPCRPWDQPGSHEYHAKTTSHNAKTCKQLSGMIRWHDVPCRFSGLIGTTRRSGEDYSRSRNDKETISGGVPAKQHLACGRIASSARVRALYSFSWCRAFGNGVL